MNLSESQVAFLDGLLSGFDDLPDGAWEACCCDAIRASGAFKRKDPHDVWLAWIAATSERLQ